MSNSVDSGKTSTTIYCAMSLSTQIDRRKLKHILDLVLTIASEFEHYEGFQLLVRKTEDSNNWIRGWNVVEKKLYKKLLRAISDEITESLKAPMFQSNLPTALD